MLWSSALILISCAMLGIAQTRQFHGDMASVSNAQVLIPIAWVLLGLGVSIAAARATRGGMSGQEWPLLATSIFVVAAMLMPTIDQLRIENWSDRTALANPVLIASEGETDGATWLVQNAGGYDVLLTADGPNNGYSGTLSAITGIPTVLGSQQAERATRPGWDGYIDRRIADVNTIYTNLTNWTMVSPLLQQYDIRYIVIGSEERLRFGDGVLDSAGVAESHGYLELVFESAELRIYRVIIADPE